MNNAAAVAFQRLAGPAASWARWPVPAHILQLAGQSFGLSCSIRPRHAAGIRSSPPSLLQRRCFSHSLTPQFRQSSILQGLRPRKNEEPEEEGLAFQSKDFSAKDLEKIFGPVYPPAQKANQVLRILHGRRNDGTLDLPLSPNMQKLLKTYPFVQESALHWLRQNHPLDEDAAIIARLEREELGEELPLSELEQRGQDIDLYGPQSGRYHARLSQSDREGDVWGHSELEQIRAENEAKAAREEEIFQAEIDQKMAEARLKQEQAKQQRAEAKEQRHKLKKQGQHNALETQPEKGLSSDVRELRPPNEFEKWVMRAYKQGTSKLDLDSPEIAEMTFIRRVLPSAFFVALICVGCYLYAQYWVPPRRADRMYPDVSLTYATLSWLAFINLTIFLAWRLPPLWNVLNKYFIMTPGFPRALSMLGCTFSHQKPLHLLNNMVALAILGSSLHEEVGRGTFMAVYIAGGAVGSLASLVFNASKQVLVTSSLGASGSVCAIVAALLWLNAQQSFTLFFLPQEYREWVQFKGWTALAVLVTYEFVSLFRPLIRIDHAGHLGGMLVGLVAAQTMTTNLKTGETQGADKRRQVGKDAGGRLAEWRAMAIASWDGLLGRVGGSRSDGHQEQSRKGTGTEGGGGDMGRE